MQVFYMIPAFCPIASLNRGNYYSIIRELSMPWEAFYKITPCDISLTTNRDQGLTSRGVVVGLTASTAIVFGVDQHPSQPNRERNFRGERKFGREMR